MTRRMERSLWIAAALAMILALCLWAPQAQASEAIDKSTDIIDISEDGTVTLISGHLAEEKLASLQLELKVEEGVAGFQFSESLGDRLKYCSHGDGTLRIFIAGSEPLLAEGETALVLGTVTGEGVRVTPVEDSLQFVRGTRMASQVLTEAVSQEPEPSQPPEEEDTGEPSPVTTPDHTNDREDTGGWEDTDDREDARAMLQAELDSAAARYGASDTRYTQDSWGALLTAVEQATQLLDRSDASQQELEAALSQLRAAIRGLVPIGRAALSETLASAKGLSAAAYTQDSYRALQDAIANADAVLADPSADEADWSAALTLLQEAIDRLVPYTNADSNGEAIPDGPDGGDSRAADDSNTPAPVTATPAPAGGAAKQQSVVPNTGDETAVLTWVALLALSGAGLILLASRRRKSR